MSTRARICIGIDPGTNTGFAVWDKQEKAFQMIGSMMIHKAIKLVTDLKTHYGVQNLYVRVEDARLAVHGRNNHKDFHKAQGAGSVKRDCSVWEDFLKDEKIDYIMLRPQKVFTKMDAVKFQQITQWTKQTNNHGRDAAMLVYGM